MTPEEIQQQIDALGTMVLSLSISAMGMRTQSTVPPHVVDIFETRRQMVEGVVSAHFGDRLPQARCIDIGCHEGFYSFAMARLGRRANHGARRSRDEPEQSTVRGGTTRAHKEIEFRQGNIETFGCLDARDLRPDAVPRRALSPRKPHAGAAEPSRTVCSDLCVIETQVIDEVEGEAEWGAQEWTRPYHGVCLL